MRTAIIRTVLHRGDLLHVGRLDRARRVRDPNSYEGPCLSCAPCIDSSDAWRRIAKLGQSPTWSLRKRGGFTLVDVRRISRAAMGQEMVAAGLLQPKRVWEVSYFDPELNDRLVITVDTRAEAELEADADDDSTIRSRADYSPTPALLSYWRQRHRRASIATGGAYDAAVIAYCDLHAPNVDGVIWRTKLGLHAAPSVALFQRSLRAVRRRKVVVRG